jgi:hypothetical protein
MDLTFIFFIVIINLEIHCLAIFILTRVLPAIAIKHIMDFEHCFVGVIKLLHGVGSLAVHLHHVANSRCDRRRWEFIVLEFPDRILTGHHLMAVIWEATVGTMIVHMIVNVIMKDCHLSGRCDYNLRLLYISDRRVVAEGGSLVSV